MERIGPSRMLTVSERLYRHLLRAYPPGFQQEYGAEMALVFRDCCRDAYSGQGTLGVISLWLSTLGDLTTTALEERIMEGVKMSKVELVRWSGVTAVMGGALWMTGVGQDIEDWSFRAIVPLFLFIAIWGLTVQAQSGWLGRIALTVAFLGALQWSVGNFFFDAYTAVSFGFVGVTIGVLLLGLAAVVKKPLARWNLLPLLIGLAPVLLELSNPYHAPGNRLPEAQGIIFILYGLAWVALGYALWARPSDSTIPPALAG